MGFLLLLLPPLLPSLMLLLMLSLCCIQYARARVFVCVCVRANAHKNMILENNNKWCLPSARMRFKWFRLILFVTLS